jgi:hypothetical protein
MPAAAFAERKNLGGIGPFSKMSDNEDPPATLRHRPPSARVSMQRTASNALRVEGPIGPLVPEFSQRPEDGSKIPSSVRRQNTGDVFPQEPLDLEVVREREEREREVSSGVCETFSETGNGEGDARRASDQKVN